MGSDNSTERKRGTGHGPSSKHVAANLRVLRKNLGIDLRELSRRMGKLKRPISPSGISRIENEERRVDADDLFALSLALEAKPSEVLVPNPETETPTAVPDIYLWEEVRAWIGGETQLSPADLFLYWERQETESLGHIDRIEKVLELIIAGKRSEKARNVYENQLDTQKTRVILAHDRQALFDSLDLSDSQYSTAEKLTDVTGD